jgi:hypothetical protein
MTRYRLVTRTTTARGTETHVSSVIQTEQECLDDLDVEESLARAAGWTTVRLETLGRAHPELVCNRGRLVRSLTIRESSWDTDTIT